MSGSRPGPPKTVVAKHPLSWTDAELYNKVKALETEWGLPLARTIERLVAQALDHRPVPSEQKQLPLDHDDTPSSTKVAA
ncbi:hypothetical protein AB0C27_53870 [Nonomuraea sp. NPDC048882]|uniref:hypothetical protein n=1 Tax=Nonomuraea sp. NPDC048882 TaxID=3154347 RepID=UPI0033FCF06B